MNKLRFYTAVMMIVIALLCIFLFQETPSHAQAGQGTVEKYQPAVDAFIEERMRALHIPGLAIAIVQDGQPAYVRGYGEGSAGVPVTPQTPFLAASLSKSFTALAVMQLVEAGQLDLDAPLQGYLPWFHTADPARSAQITVRHLLYHTSGLSEFEGDLRNLETDRGQGALEASLRRLGDSPLTASPGERFEYSNTNYDLLGLLVQTVSGKPYADYIQQEIFAPLGLQHSYTSLEEARQNGLSQGSAAFFGLTLPYDRWMPVPRTVLPSAGLFLSAADLARYLALHLDGGRLPDGTHLLSPAGMNQLHQPGIQIGKNVFYAMGWTQFAFNQAAPAGGPGAPPPLGLAHGGDWANYKALTVMVSEHKLGVALLVNKQDWGQESAYEAIAWNTVLLALGLPLADFPPSEDFMTRYGRVAGSLLVLLLFASFLWSARRLRSPTWDLPGSPRRQNILLFLVILPLIDLALAAYLLLVQSVSLASLRLDLAFSPDAGLLYLLLFLLTLGWGSLRTLLALRRLLVKAREAAPAF